MVYLMVYTCRYRFFLQMQDFLANARFSCKCKIFLQMQDFLANARFSCKCKIFLQMQDFLANARFSCKMQDFLANARFSCKCKIFLQMQDFLANARFSCKCKIFLQMQDFLANARFSCKCKIFLQMQDFLPNARFSCKCKIFLPLNVKVLFQAIFYEVHHMAILCSAVITAWYKNFVRTLAVTALISWRFILHSINSPLRLILTYDRNIPKNCRHIMLWLVGKLNIKNLSFYTLIICLPTSHGR